MLADPRMRPPVALLCYAPDDPGSAAFWPFAEFSPECEAARWACRNGAAVRLIDLPFAARIEIFNQGSDDAPVEPLDDGADPPNDLPADDESGDAGGGDRIDISRDPIGALARAAGYEDGESWWSDVIEENPAPGPIFAALRDAMAALREEEGTPVELEALREAHMRLQIAAARKAFDGPIAVVCGAWHAPALESGSPLKDDRARLKGLSKRKTKATWVPWTAPRLAYSSGYGAGVVAPGWCMHLWNTAGRDDGAAIWLTRIAASLRQKGHMVSTASLIEAERLGHALAAIRGKPRAGFEELRDACIAAMCHGAELQWATIAADLLVGAGVGEVPDDAIRDPLLEDLQRCQRAARLKPESLERELSVDLRTESGLTRSILLHRLAVLDVPWGQLTDSGRSRGTFRERWILAWQPEFAVQLVEHLVFGATIEKAANGRLISRIKAASSLESLAMLGQSAIVSDLAPAATVAIDALRDRAAKASDCVEIVRALPPLSETIRYGDARTVSLASGTASGLRPLMEGLVVRAAVALGYAARALDTDAARTMATALTAADGAVRLVETEGDSLRAWHDGLRGLVDESRATALISGTAAQLLYRAEILRPDEAAVLLARRLSPGTPLSEAAGFLEGFFEGAAQRLIYEHPLREAVDGWLSGLDAQAFMDALPLFRRVFSGLDRMERRRLLDALMGRSAGLSGGLVAVDDGGAAWQRHLAALIPILRAGRDAA